MLVILYIWPIMYVLCSLVREAFILLVVGIMARRRFVVRGLMMRPFVHEGERLDTSVGRKGNTRHGA